MSEHIIPDYSSFTSGALFERFGELTKELEAVRKAMKKVLKVKREPKVDLETGEKVKRAPTAWIAWTTHVKSTYPEEYADFAAGQPSKKGVLPAFAKRCRDNTHAEEWEEFEAAHKAAHPPAAKSTSKKAAAAAASVLDSDSEDEGTSMRSSGGAGAGAGLPTATPVGKSKKSSKKGEEKPKSETKKEKKSKAAAALETDSEVEEVKPVKKEKAKKEAKKETKKETKKEKAAGGGAAAAAALLDVSDDEEELTSFVHEGATYLQNAAGHTWTLGAGGQPGKWAGIYDSETGSLDPTAPNPYEDDE